MKHLLENFTNFPVAREDFLNGHILCIFALKCDNSCTSTERELLSLLPSDPATFSLPINAAIQKVVDRILNSFILYEFGVSTSPLFQRISFIL